jgi:hypothetical protein
MPSYDRALHALRTWLDSWSRIGHVAVGMHRQGACCSLTPTSATGTGWEALSNADEVMSPSKPSTGSTAAAATWTAASEDDRVWTYFRNLVGRQWSQSVKLPGVGYVLTVSEYDLYSSDARVLFQGR